MLQNLSAYIIENWQRFFPGSVQPIDITYIGISGSVEGGTCTFLAFTDRNKHPAFVVKIHRHLNAEVEVINERDILNYLRQRSKYLAATVPSFVFCRKFDYIWAIVESVLDGSPMAAVMKKDGFPDPMNAKNHFILITNWLEKLRSATEIDRTSNSGAGFVPVIKTIEEFLAVFNLSKNERDWADRIMREIESVTALVSLVQHGDFCRHNILVSGPRGQEKIGVIDWTSGKRDGLPFHDLFFFITTYFLQLRKHHGIEGFRKAFKYTFFGKTPYSAIVKNCIEKYCLKVGIDIHLVKDMFVLFLMERAVFEYRQIVQSSMRNGLPRFTIYLAAHENLDYMDALKAQFWIEFFKIFIAEHTHSIF